MNMLSIMIPEVAYEISFCIVIRIIFARALFTLSVAIFLQTVQTVFWLARPLVGNPEKLPVIILFVSGVLPENILGILILSISIGIATPVNWSDVKWISIYFATVFLVFVLSLHGKSILKAMYLESPGNKFIEKIDELVLPFAILIACTIVAIPRVQREKRGK